MISKILGKAITSSFFYQIMSRKRLPGIFGHCGVIGIGFKAFGAL